MRPSFVTLFAVLTAAAPFDKRQATTITDAQILNYALTLEHLEATFYQEGLANFTQQDFEDAGLGGLFYNNLKEIAHDETTHVSFLTGALQAAGAPATAACDYAFGTTTLAEFVTVANVLEGVGVSAYLGAAASIVNKDYLTAAGSILTVEARHSAFWRENQSPPQSPFPSPFDIPLDFNEVYSLAVQFITSCPKSNPPLPVKAFPAITLTSPSGEVVNGTTLELTVAESVMAAGAYFITSTGSVAAPLMGSGTKYSVTVPSGAQAGQEYLVLTKDMNAPTDENIVAGPVVIMVADNDYGVTVPPTPCPSETAPPMSSQAPPPPMSSKASPPLPATTTMPAPPATTCPGELTGAYQTPHLIVPIKSTSPNQAYGTQYTATITETECVIFNFDIPASYAGKTCEYNFLFPEQSMLETSSYTLSGSGSLDMWALSSAADQSTSWNNAPAKASHLGGWSPSPGSKWSPWSGSCAAGTAVSVEMCASESLSFTFFEDT
ncbi:hypothetical protein PRZ48_014231 [Zasmidium cellare]|uniref:Ubiquitin 3 binding protein But2 C-terminal domain-containing protein n=1 Tax=Zasmidium cellare TaxID=395010 RepID=A0ABR0E0U1_ZASCE|nr:hypothetical protein PRZ48_014231 [Zasmidium cellare]